MKREILFKTEAEMCSAFVEWLKKFPDWTPYAETAGWDLLLAHRDGTQIGIQAKLKFNVAVLSQAIEHGFPWSTGIGPDYRAILVPARNGRDLCDALGLTQIHAGKTWDGKIYFSPDFAGSFGNHWHYWNPTRRHDLPAYVPDVAAGSPSPIALTKWKIAALEICALLEIRGFVTGEDFRVAGIDHRRWTNYWLEHIPGTPGAYRWREGIDQGFSKQHPVVYPQILQKVMERQCHLPK